MSATTGLFVQAMNAPGLRKVGVKGSDVYTEEGVGDGRVALFQQLVRGCGREYINNAIQNAFSTGASDDVLRDYVVMAFQTRDIRGGKGERDLFYTLLCALFQARPLLIKPLVELIPEYGCWQDAWKLWFSVEDSVASSHAVDVKSAIKDLVVRTWFKDVATADDKPVSLLGKWLPREKSKYHTLAVEFANAMFPEIEDVNDKLRAYRKSCAALNARLKTTEVSMCGGTWTTIEPGKVPGRLLNKCRVAFLNEIRTRKGRPANGELRYPDREDRMTCREHFKTHMAAALRGEVSVKGADVVYPHEIVSKYLRGNVTTDEDALLQAQWNAIRDATAAAGGLKGAVPLCDFSGSMSGTPMEVSMALGILLSEINHPAFRDGMIGFDYTPSWISFKPEMSLKEKVRHAKFYAQGTSTNFQAACDLILTRLIDYKVPAEEAPKDMIVFTDMGFDQASGMKTSAWETHVERIRNSFTCAGYVAPRIVLWNLRAEYKDFHAKANEEGVVILSGWSPAILKAIQKAGVEVRTPYEGMKELLDDARYDAVRAAWAAGAV